MKRFAALAALLVLVLSLTACGAAADKGEIVSGDDGDTLETLCGADYQAYITETITMQMGNRMDKDPAVVYFPIAEKAPLTDYAGTYFFISQKRVHFLFIIKNFQTITTFC